MCMPLGQFNCPRAQTNPLWNGIRNNSQPLYVAEYKEYTDANVIFYAEDELTPAGLKRHMDDLRAAFIPVLSKIDLSKE
jgi:hypothetical protein